MYVSTVSLFYFIKGMVMEFKNDYKNNKSLLRLRKDYGLFGYWVYNYICDIIIEEEGRCFPYSDLDLIAHEIRMPIKQLNKIIMEYDLFDYDSDDDVISIKFILRLTNTD